MEPIRAIDRCLIDGEDLEEMCDWDGDESGTYSRVWFECRTKERHYYHAKLDAGDYIPTDAEFEERYPGQAAIRRD